VIHVADDDDIQMFSRAGNGGGHGPYI
jgi:hypothetical protein